MKKFLKDEKLVVRLNGSGDFASQECVELLKQSDIVCTNPPHSLFRKYIDLIVKYDKKFLVIGNLNAITYKEIFPLLKENKLWLGVSIHSGDRKFLVSKNIFDKTKIQGKYETNENGDYYVPVMGVRWFTNLDHKKRHEKIDLVLSYTSEKYPKYDNYDAINVDKVVTIPCDYDGNIGVPISFMDKYNPEQFEIIGMSSSAGYDSHIVVLPKLKDGDARPLINGKTIYARIFIRRK